MTRKSANRDSTACKIEGASPPHTTGLSSGGESSEPNDRHLRTDHLLVNLERRAISSGAITLGSQATQFFLTFGSTMVLARLLTPADFGLVAMLMTVMGFLRVFKDVGLSTATIQREGITHAQVSNLFWVNVTVSGAIGLALAAASPLIAWFYREPRLIPITLVLATSFPLSGLAVQHTALLNRQMRFKALAMVQVSSQLAGYGVGFGMAWAGYGYWSLVGLNLATAIVGVVLTFLAVPWRPQAPTRRTGTGPLIDFGANLAAGGFVFSLARGLDGLLLGRVYGSDAVGLYSRAGALLNRPMEQLLGSSEAVFVPMLSRIQQQTERYHRTFLQFYEATALLSCLFTGMLLALSRPITLFVLGPQWEQAAIIFAGFTVSAMCSPIAAVASWLFASQGRGRGMLVMSSVVSLTVVVSVVVGLPFGPAGVAISHSLLSLAIGLPVAFYLAGREGPVTTADLWRGFLLYVPVWAVVSGTTYAAYRLNADVRPIVQLVLCIPVGLIAGTVVIAIFPRLRRTALSVVAIPRQLLHPRATSDAH